MSNARANAPVGLLPWMKRVVAELARARAGFEEEAVHDLRVAIRRCRSMAEVVRVLDPDRDWRRMRKAGKTVFAALGELRDVQVQILWIDRLQLSGAAAERLKTHLLAREQELKHAAEAALAAFNCAQWLAWGERLDRRQSRIPPGGPVFQALALEKWQEARALHRAALRNRSNASLHALRIGVKRFRYVAENFLPDYYRHVGKQLKHCQDLLGEIHDLDVLWQTAQDIGLFAGEGHAPERHHWHAAISTERSRRVDEYRRLAIGANNVWRRWRKLLPVGEALAVAVREKIAAWSAFRDSDIPHTRRVLRHALKIYDALARAGRLPGIRGDGVGERELLTVAILGHEAVPSAGGKRHKKARRALQRLGPPPGWTDADLLLAGLVARYHRGALPSRKQRTYGRLRAAQRSTVDRLAGIVRFADALSGHERPFLQLRRVVADDFGVLVLAAGYDPRSRAAERIAAASHLLQVVLGIPVTVRAAGAKSPLVRAAAAR